LSTTPPPEGINHARRRLFGAAGAALTAARFGWTGSARAQAGSNPATAVPPMAGGAPTAFGPVRQIDVGVLNIGYVELGPLHGPAVILLHGWPYDIHSYVEVAP
jgi:hypothetical protein